MAQPTKTVGHTRRNVKSVSYEWEIDNLSFFSDDHLIESPTFTAGDQFTWKLEIVPKWKTDDKFWGLRIHLLSHGLSAICKTAAVLVNSNGQVIKELTSPEPWNTAIGSGLIWKIDRKFYFANVFKVHGDRPDNLTVKVRIKYSPQTTVCTTEVQRPIPPGMWDRTKSQIKKLFR